MIAGRLQSAARAAGSRARAGRYFGPFRGRASAQQAQALLARLFGLRTCSGRLRPAADVTPCLQGQIGACSEPCTERIDRGAYVERVAAAERFFDGEIGAAQGVLEQRREAHSAAGRFEAAAKAQRELELLRRMRNRQRTMSWIVARQHFVVMQPSAAGGEALLYAVAYGRLVARGAARCAADLQAFADAVDHHLEQPDAAVLQPADVDGTIILAAWLRARGERDGYVFPLGEAAAGALRAWSAALADVLARA